ncbi:AMP-binding protein [soil metagenome]
MPIFPPSPSLRQRLSDLPRRVRAATKMSVTTGLIWELQRPGLREMLKVFGREHQNPSAIYAIHGANRPAHPALIHRGRVITFGELENRLSRFGGGLRRRGLARKESVLVVLRNRPELVEVSAGLQRVGCASAAVSYRSTAKELAFLIENSGARFVVFEHDLFPAIEEAAKLAEFPIARLVAVGERVPGTTYYEDVLDGPPATVIGDDEAAAVVTYTSGTTGKPKGAVRRFPKETFVAALEFIAETPLHTSDVHLVTCPLYHMTAYGFLTFSHLVGATAVIADEFKPELFLELVERHRVTTTALVPTMLHRIVSLDRAVLARYRTRSLRAIFCGGAALTGQLAADAMDLLGDVLFNFYGATETGVVTLAKPKDLRAAPGTIGRALPGNAILLLDDDKREVGPDGIGELFVKNGQLVSGYHKNQAATDDSMREGFFGVGDLARTDRDGLYFIEGRKRDMVISGGVNVYPAEVEAAIEEHPKIFEAAVIGVPDPEWGERVKACVVAKPGETLDLEELKSFLRARLAGPKVPREYEILSKLPRNPTGKVLKNELRGQTGKTP